MDTTVSLQRRTWTLVPSELTLQGQFGPFCTLVPPRGAAAQPPGRPPAFPRAELPASYEPRQATGHNCGSLLFPLLMQGAGDHMHVRKAVDAASAASRAQVQGVSPGNPAAGHVPISFVVDAEYIHRAVHLGAIPKPIRPSRIDWSVHASVAEGLDPKHSVASTHPLKCDCDIMGPWRLSYSR